MAINLPIVSKFDNKGVKAANGAFDGMGKKLAGLGAIVATAFSIRAVVDFSKESVLAAEAIQTSGARIDSIASSMGVFGSDIDSVTQRLKDYANVNEQLLATDENVIMQTQAKLLTFKELANTAGEAGSSFDRATAAAIDLGAAGFGSATDNAVQLGKALNDPITGVSALARVGLTFTDAEKEKIKALQESGNLLEAQDMILSGIESQVKGTAAATADASVQMGLAFGEIKESVGAGLLPAFEGFTGAVLPLVTSLLPQIDTLMSEKITPALENVTEAFANFIELGMENGFGEAISGQFGSIGDSISTFFSGGGLEDAFTTLSDLRMSLFNSIMDALPGILDAIIEFIPKLVEFITGTLLPTMLSQFSEMMISVLELFAELFPKIVTALAEIIPDLVQGVADLLPQIVETLTDMIPELLKTGIEVFMSLVNAVLDILPDLLSTIIGMVPDIVDSVMEMLPDIIEAGIDLFNGLIKAVIDVLPELLKSILGMLPDILDTIIGMIPQLITAGFDLFAGLIEGLLDALPDIIDAVIDMIPEITGALMDSLPKLVTAGMQIVGGLAKGIIDNAPRLLGEAIGALGNTLVNGVKGFLGIRSPSKVFAGIGGDVVDGLEQGLNDGEKIIASASLNMAQNLKVSSEDNMRFTPTVMGRGGDNNSAPRSGNVININVNAGVGADGNRIGQLIVDEILKFERSSGKVFARA